MAIGTDATVSWYDLEATIKAIENNDQTALEQVLPNLRVDFETATAA